VLPGKKYSPEEIGFIVLRRAWIVILLTAIGGGVAVAVSKRLPNQFKSETLIMLVPQRIPDAYVKAAVTASIADRLNSLEDQILSRSRLERIILDLDLYPALRKSRPMEDVVAQMRDHDITVKTENKESFRISYISGEAKTAQKTTERLASLFIEENLRDRENLAEDTSQFLNSQLEDAKRRLVEHEKKLEEYRGRYGGELPTQVTSNLQAIQNAQTQLQSLGDAADRARERRLLLERQAVDLQATPEIPLTPASAPATGSPDGIAGDSAAAQLQSAKSRLQILLLHDKPDHPDVKMMQRTIRDLEAKAAEEAKRAAAAAVATSAEKPAAAASSPAERLREQRIKDIRLQIEDIDRQLVEKQEQDKRLRATVAEYQAKLDAVPRRESDLVELTRDYTTLQATYQSLLTKREEAKLAANLERRNICAQFKVLDPARAPERPFSPNRLQLDLGGAGSGLALGLLIVAFLEYKDSSLKSEEDAVRLLDLRVLAMVPLMASEADRRTRRWRFVLVGAVAIALVVSGAAFSLWRLRS
jgi:polysaccharide chain length determinant protein (PEP-CTERM system associated)